MRRGSGEARAWHGDAACRAMSGRVCLEPGFVLHRRPYRETSLLVELLSRHHGRVGLVARGARRQRSVLRGLLEPFTPLLLDWDARGELGTLRSAERSEGGHAPLVAGVLPAGFYLNELLVRLLHRDDPHPVLFDDYAMTLAGLAAPGGVEPLLRVFEKRLLDSLGYGLVLRYEARSQRPVTAYGCYDYFAEEGPRPATGGDPPPGAVRVAGRTLLALADEALDEPQSLREAKRLMRRALAPHLGERPLHSRTMFRRGD